MAQSFNLVAQLQLQGPQNINQIVNRIQSQLNNIQANIGVNIPTGANAQLKNLNSNLGQTAKVAQTAQNSMKKVAVATNDASQSFVKFGHDSRLAIRRFAAFSITAGIMIGVITNIKRGIKNAIDFQREMIRVAQVTGKTTTQLVALSKTISNLSTSLGVASGELIQVARTLSQAGLSVKETKIALDAIAKTDLSPTFDNMKQTTEGVIAAMRQFRLEAGQMEGVLGSINAVSARFAVESSDIISAVRRTGGAFKAAGGDINELIALFTSVRSTTRESADSIATGFRTIFTRLQRPRTIEFLRSFGIELQTIEGNFVGPLEATRALSIALKNLDPKQERFSRIVEELGGFRQVSKVIPLIQQFKVTQEALNVAMSGSSSLSEDATLAQDALAVSLTKVVEVYNELFREITRSDLFNELANSAIKLSTSLAQVFRQFQPIIPLLAGIVGAKGLSVTRQFASGFFGGGKNAAVAANTQATVQNTIALNTNSGVSSGGVVGRKPGAGTGTKGNLGRGVGATLATTVVLSAFASTMTDAESATQKWISTITKSIITFEILRLAVGGIQSAGGALKGAGIALAARTGGGFGAGAPKGVSRGGLFPGGSVGAPKRPIFRGQNSTLNTASKSLTGFNFATVAATAGLTASVVAIEYFNSKLLAAGNKEAEAAQTTEDMSRALAKVTQGATGTARAFVKSFSQFGLVGAIDRGVRIGKEARGDTDIRPGGIVENAIVDFFSDAPGAIEAAKKSNRERRLAESEDTLSVALSRLTSGDEKVAGSTQVGVANREIADLIQVAKEASFAGDTKGLIGINKTMRGMSIATNTITEELIDNAGGLEEFKKEVENASTWLEFLARTTNRTILEVEQEQKRRLATIKAVAEAERKEAASKEKTTSILSTLSAFGGVLTETTQRMQSMSNEFDVLTSLARGNVAISGFTGLPGFGNASRATTGSVTNVPQFEAALTQTMSGLGSPRMTERIIGITRMLNELPKILNEVGAGGALDPEDTKRQFERIFKERFGEVGEAKALMDSLVPVISSQLSATGGPRKFASASRSNPAALAQSLIPSQYTDLLQQTDTISASIVQATKMMDDNIRQQLALEIEITNKRLQMAKNTSAASQKIFSLTNKSPRAQFGLDRIRAEKGSQISGVLQGTTPLDPFDIQALSSRLTNVNERIATANATRQGLSPGEELNKITESLKIMNAESQKFRTALQLLTDVTAEAASIQKTLNLLENDKKARFGVAERFTFGSDEDRAKIKRDIKNSALEAVGLISLKQLSPEQRGGVQSFRSSLRDTQSLAFGVNDDGTVRTGHEAIANSIKEVIGSLPALLGVDKGVSAEEFINSIDPQVNTPEQAAFAGQLDGLYKERTAAELALLTNMETNQDKFLTKMANELQLWTKILADKLSGAQTESLSRQIQNNRAQSTTVSGQLAALQSGSGLTGGFLSGERTNQSNLSIINAIGGNAERLALHDTIIAAGQFTSKLSTDLAGGASTSPLEQTFRGQTVGLGTDTPAAFQAALISGVEKSLATTGLVSVDDIATAMHQSLADSGITAIDDLVKQGVLTNARVDSLFRSVAEVAFNAPVSDLDKAQLKPGDPDAKTLITRAFIDNLQKAILESKTSVQEGIRAEAGVDLSQRGQFAQLLESGDIQAFKTLFDILKGLDPKNISGLSDQAKELEANFRTLNDTLRDPDIPHRGDVTAQYRAAGGSIFARRGTDTVPAMLTPGEFVVKKSVAQQNMGMLTSLNGGATNGGGIGYHNGGEVRNNRNRSIMLSGDAREVLVQLPQQIANAMRPFLAQLESSSQIINEASASFYSSVTLLTQSMEQLPIEIATALNESATTFNASTQHMKDTILHLGTATETWNQGLTQMTNLIANIGVVSESMRGTATEIRDALAQEIQINVTHTHEPISVTVQGGETTTQDGSAFSEMVMKVVGPEIDTAIQRIKEIGFGIA